MKRIIGLPRGTKGDAKTQRWATTGTNEEILD